MPKKTNVGLLLCGMFLLAAAGIFVWRSPEYHLSWPLVGMALLTVFYLGKFVVIMPVLETNLPFTPFFLGCMVMVLEMSFGMIVVAYLDFLHHLPLMGRRIARMEGRSRRMLKKRPWIKQLATYSVMMFVLLPFPGTGAVGGTILGRLIGLGAGRILLGIGLGTLIGSLGLAAGADYLAEVLLPIRHFWWFRLTGFVLLLSLIGFSFRYGMYVVQEEEDVKIKEDAES